MPVIPSFIEGYDMDNIEYMSKSYYLIKDLKQKTELSAGIIKASIGYRLNLVLAKKQASISKPARAGARNLAYNLYSIKIRQNMAGTISVFSTEINGKPFASAGVIERC